MRYERYESPDPLRRAEDRAEDTRRLVATIRGQYALRVLGTVALVAAGPVGGGLFAWLGPASEGANTVATLWLVAGVFAAALGPLILWIENAPDLTIGAAKRRRRDAARALRDEHAAAVRREQEQAEKTVQDWRAPS